MDTPSRPGSFTRRGFVRGLAGAAAGAALGLATREVSAQQDPELRVIYRRLGRTDFQVSHIVAAWDWNEWIYGEAVAVGINYWHKIGGWRAIPEPLRALDREAWYCDVVIDTFDEQGAYDQFEWARKSLGLEYVDAFKLHSIYQKPEDVRAKTGLLKAFERLKAEGKVRHLAAAQHGGETAAICAAMIESDWFDHIQPALSVTPDANALAMLELATKHDVGIIAKKVMGAVARAKQEPAVRQAVEQHLGPEGKWGTAVIKTLLSLPGVTAVTPRTQSFEQLLDNLLPAQEAAAGQADLCLTAPESLAVEELRRFARSEQCSYCGQCLAVCPRELAISDVLRFATYHTVYDEPRWARRLYAQLPSDRRAGECADCGACERACPQGLPVRRKLREAAALLA